MLDNYFGGNVNDSQRKRLLAVQAALEIAKQSAGSSAGASTIGTMKVDLRQAAEEISLLADAIQSALNKS